MIIEMEIYRASAFSKNGAGGNKAGVVLDGAALTRGEKQAIAKEVGYSETVFFSESGAADFRLEYFTPEGEVPLCGHATVAAFVVLGALKRLQKSEYTIETGAGVLRVSASADGAVMMEQNSPTFAETFTPSELAECFDAGAFADGLPIRVVSTGLRDILLPIRSEAALAGLAPDLAALRRLSAEKEVVGVHAFALAERDGVDAVCRNFAPLYGIDEESATGTSNGALACYLHRYAAKKSAFLFEQGAALGAPSEIAVRLAARDDEIAEVFVGGRGYVLGE
ncbi:MAG: PhzF family phenazine biosynthesis protein [Bacteroides sp.]|nr:PhzF family phenazine biosynthesis protein [Eubacterium sp.]MCM1417396.1 PhzF family phenazine biosynthesis protein [Roseburia sp.]MCM1461411.1 PhzF family phenazine biosynthesis protein [Bacteroides sp.]